MRAARRDGACECSILMPSLMARARRSLLSLVWQRVCTAVRDTPRIDADDCRLSACARCVILISITRPDQPSVPGDLSCAYGGRGRYYPITMETACSCAQSNTDRVNIWSDKCLSYMRQSHLSVCVCGHQSCSLYVRQPL